MKAGKYGLLILLSWLALGSARADHWETAGSVLAFALPLTALTATYTLDDADGRERLLVSYALTMGAAVSLKAATDVERPDDSDRLSFPSAHTASAFSGASFLQRRYGWEVGLPAYLGASYVGWSRINAERAHIRDVMAGAVLGWGINAWLVPEPHQAALAIWPTEGGAVLAFEWQF